MSRILRLFACAAGMLAVAVLACMLLQDEETVNAGSHAVSGKIKGFEGAVAPSAQKPASIAENAEQKTESRSGAARVKVLELARAAAENKARAESAKAEPVQAEAPAVKVPDVQEAQAKSEKAVEAEALALLAPEEPAAPKPEAQKAPAQTEAKKPEQKAASKKAEAKKAEAEKADVKKAEKKVEAVKSAKSLSPVESALADARSGRLSPGEDFMTESDPAATYDRVITSAKFSMKGSLIKLTLRGNSPMVGHFYVLEDPDRVVLDLAGNWKVDMPKVPSNRLIGAVRVGQHEDKTRLVFDMKEMGKVALVPLNRNALELRIQ